MTDSLNVFIRGTISFFVILILTRLSGKQQISQLTFFDYVFGITVGNMAGSATTDFSSEVIPAIIGMTTWTLWVLVIGVIGIYNRKLHRLETGEPTIVIQNGKILEDNLKQINYSLDDMRMQLRVAGVFSLSDVEFAILEPDGQISVLKKSQVQTLTPKDIHLATQYQGLSTELIVSGVVVKRNLEQLGLTKEWLDQKLREKGLTLNEVFYAEIDTQGELYIDVKDDLEKLPQVQDITDYEWWDDSEGE